jgi:hypothetical protein
MYSSHLRKLENLCNLRVRDVFNKNKCYHPDDNVIIQPDDNVYVIFLVVDNIDVIIQSDVNHIIYLDDNIDVIIQPDDNVYVIFPLDNNIDVIIQLYVHILPSIWSSD